MEIKPIIAKVYQDTVHFLIFRVTSTEKVIESAFNLFSALLMIKAIFRETDA